LQNFFSKPLNDRWISLNNARLDLSLRNIWQRNLTVKRQPRLAFLVA